MGKPFLNFFPRFFFSSLWGIGIFFLFVLDFSKAAKELPIFPHADKLVHAFLFFIQTGILLWELNRRSFTSANKSMGRLFIWSVSLPFMFGIMIEIIQGFLPYRGADLFDLLFDLLGSLAAFACIILLMKCYKTKT